PPPPPARPPARRPPPAPPPPPPRAGPPGRARGGGRRGGAAGGGRARRERDCGPDAAARNRGLARRALVGLGATRAGPERGRQARARPGPVHLPGVHLYRAIDRKSVV